MANYNYHTLAKVNRGTYVVLIVLLLFVLFFGRSIRGSARWIDLGFFQLQPAEFAKVIVVIGLSRWFYLFRGEINSWKNVLLTIILAGIPAGLVLVEPDLGSSMVIMAVWFGILLVSSISKRRLLVLILCGMLAVAGVWQFVLHDYQRVRLETFLDPNLDPRGRGYNVRQAIIAVGSGEAFGRGLGKGLQSQLKFLPERQTDFIFATAAEEIGFLGSALMVLLYALLMWRMLMVAARARDELGRYLAYGIFFFFFFQVTINIAMNLGLAPVTGIPLPLLSYGGSSLLVTFLALGIVHNISWQSRALRF
jgi:rod shape determining protein RodA